MQPKRQLGGLREDGAVPPSVETCVVCHQLRSSGSRNQDGDVFICTQCEADADQLFEIQDAIWPPVVVAGESTDEAATPAQP
jgi:hypothetical protein